jgi:pimeloyl-ACP methyl ester carboxylesterase
MTSAMSSTGDPDVGQASPEARELIFGPRPTDRASYIQRQVDGSRTYGSPAQFDEARVRESANESFDRSFDPAGTARQLMAINASPSRTAALGSVTVPTLVLHGDLDCLIDASGGRRTAEAIAGARLEIIEGMGHDYPPVYWDRWVELVAEHARTVVA